MDSSGRPKEMPVKENKHPKVEKKSQADLLEEINKEITSLFEYLEKNNITGKEYDVLTGPLVDAVELSQKKQRTHKFIKRFALWFSLFAGIYLLFQITWVQKIATVLIRKILIFLLPWWDWTRIYFSDCILTNPFYVTRSLNEDDCNVCESLEVLDRLNNVSARVVTEEYLNNDLPFVVTDAMDSWQVMNTDNFWFENITELYMSEELMDTYPCELTTNLRLKHKDLRHFLRRIHDEDVRRWYGYWENCDKKAAKALRSFYKRPYYIPHMVDLSDSNWVLLSSNYKGKVYKEINFSSEMLFVAQIRGWSKIRLVPREPCNNYCPELLDSITEGQMIVVTSLLWVLEYIPGENSDNLAIAVGGFWN